LSRLVRIEQDMVSLNYLHEPGVLHNVKSRFDIDEIYTYTGHILIAVNPFRDVSHLYGLERMHEFNEARMQAPQPHAYAVADEAFHRLFDSGANQSILVSGESGAGKTETVKLVMQYLAFKGGQSHGSDKPVEQQVLQSNPLLEAFGNAKTARNDNSSRFGKYVEVQLAPDGSIAGAGVCTYLLERSRVVQVTAPERNYHIFYQLLSGADERESESLRLRRPEDFRLLNQSGMYSLRGRDNASEFAKTKEAMRFVGFSDEQAHSALRIVAGVLHLGNITFSAGNENNNAELANRGAEEALHDCAEVLQVDTEQLRNALITRRIITPEGEIDTNLSVETAQSNRDALAKTMYSRLFDWIVSAINASIGATGAITGTIGLLDIYGFESFDSNSFEQFNINHANEKLQQHFNEEVFKNEQREYKNEGIEWSYIDFIDNQDVLELIEQKKGGILALLDEACRLGSSTPRDFTQRVFQLNGEHPRMRQCRGSEQDFVISHYAGEVKYSADAFLEKNTDYVVAEHADLLVSSKDLLLSSLFAETQQQAGSTRSRMQFSSVGNRFKQQLQELMTELRRTDPHFIRCIKPNEDSRPDLFNSKFVLHQMKCGGVLEAVRISCAGYPSRKTFVDFINRYWVLNPDAVYKAESDRELCKHLCRSAGADLDYQVGFSKIFLRSRSVALLDSKRDEVRTSSTVTIQRLYRMHLARASFRRARDAALKIQVRDWSECVLSFSLILNRKGFISRLYAQTVRRGQIARRWALMQKEAIVTTIQRYWRGYHVRRKRNLESWSAIRVQIAWKRYRRQRRLAKASAASRITQTARVHLQRKHEAERAEAGRRAAIVIQCAWRQKNARYDENIEHLLSFTKPNF
jgi:myosin-5